MENTFGTVLKDAGFSADRSGLIATVFTDSTFRGVFSHGINRFPRFIREVREGIVLPHENPALFHALHALEQWDGRRGPGITNAIHCADRSVELAGEFGIGCVGLRNTNHWMRWGSYGWRVAEKGFLFLGWTNTTPNMPPWGGQHAPLGNNPLVMALPYGNAHLVLDMAMSQFSYGKMEWHLKRGSRLPQPGGLDRQGELTSETDLSQVFISIDIGRYRTREQRHRMIEHTLEFMTGEDPGTRFPGQGSNEQWNSHLEKGVEIPGEVWQEILSLPAEDRS